MAEFTCQAYGTDPRCRGMCFFEQVGRCESRRHCEARLTGERRRLWHLLHERVAAGDEVAAALLAEVRSPADLLNAERR